MQAVILAGGLGTRISEETDLKPKPMVEIGGKPILWHIMKIYSAYGINDFIICLGYKGYLIKEYFANYYMHQSDVTFDMQTNSMQVHQNTAEPWKVTLVDTGALSQTGGRLKRIARYLDGHDFCFTYGDGVADVDLDALIAFHNKKATLATVTAVQMPGRFGSLGLVDNKVSVFEEKPKGDGSWVSGGYFVLSPKVINYIKDDLTLWEAEPLQNLARAGELSAFRHEGFWQPMDTLRDKTNLEALWNSGSAPWHVWD